MAKKMANPTLYGDEQAWRLEVVSQQSREGLESKKMVRQHGGRLEYILIISILRYKYLSVLPGSLVKSATQRHAQTDTHTELLLVNL